MKVKELIELLQTFDQELEVMTEYEDQICYIDGDNIRLTTDEGEPIVLIS